MAAVADLWKSERGILCVFLIIAATVLAALSVLTKDDWLDYTKWIFGFYVAGKSITGAVDVATRNKKGDASK